MDKKHKLAVFEQPFTLESGDQLPQLTVAYHTYGQLNKTKDNAILICHALTGDAFVAGQDQEGTKGWWDPLVGPGKTLDTEKHYVICSNVLGGCHGTTGPASINPLTGKPWGMSFPIVTIKDMVKAQYLLIRYLGVEKLTTVIGGSLGGMQALEWGILHPELVKSIIPIATSSRHSPMAIGYNLVSRRAITQDPSWQKGDYYPSQGPTEGLALARMLATLTYKSDASFTMRFRRNMESPEKLFTHQSSFEVESYLKYQEKKLTKRFDANSYLYLLKAMDLHDVSRGIGSVKKAFQHIQGKILLVGISSDTNFPYHEQREMVTVLHRLGKDVEYFEIDSPYGHDAFLTEFEQLEKGLGRFLAKLT